MVPRWSLDSVLDNEEAVEAFRAFCTSEMNEENVREKNARSRCWNNADAVCFLMAAPFHARRAALP